MFFNLKLKTLHKFMKRLVFDVASENVHCRCVRKFPADREEGGRTSPKPRQPFGPPRPLKGRAPQERRRRSCDREDRAAAEVGNSGSPQREREPVDVLSRRFSARSTFDSVPAARASPVRPSFAAFSHILAVLWVLAELRPFRFRPFRRLLDCAVTVLILFRFIFLIICWVLLIYQWRWTSIFLLWVIWIFGFGFGFTFGFCFVFGSRTG